MIHGECLCGAVAFDLARDGLDIYQCHCSLCRRATGSNANAGAIVDGTEFAWGPGLADDAIGSHRCPTGYRNDFCRRCGSTVPNLMADGLRVWLPVGLLGDHPGIRLVRHLHLESRAGWDPVTAAD